MKKRLWSVVPTGAMIASLTGRGGGTGTESAVNTNVAGEVRIMAGRTGTTVAAGNAASGDTVKIDILTDRSSAATATVVWVEAGVELAAQEISETDGVNGKQVELVYRDTGFDSANVAQKSIELVGEGAIAILGPKSDGEAPIGAQRAETNKFPMVMPCTMNTRVTIENAPRYMFFYGFSVQAVADVNMKYTEKQGYKSAYFIGNDGGASEDSRDFSYEYLGDDYTNMGFSQAASSATESSNIISSTVGKGPDAITGAVTGPNFVSLINQGQQFGLWDMYDYLGWYTYDSTNITSLVDTGNYPHGKVHGVGLWPFQLSDIGSNDKLVENYGALRQKLYRQDIPPSGMGYIWYISITTIREALETTDDQSPEGVITALEDIKFDTIYGEGIGFCDFDHVMNYAYYYVTAVEDITGKRKIPVGGIYKVYMAEEVLPIKEQMQDYASKDSLTFMDLSTLKQDA